MKRSRCRRVSLVYSKLSALTEQGFDLQVHKSWSTNVKVWTGTVVEQTPLLAGKSLAHDLYEVVRPHSSYWCLKCSVVLTPGLGEGQGA